LRNTVVNPTGFRLGNSKYFHVERGVTYCNFTSNQFSGFHGIVIPGTLHDSPYVLDGLLEHQTELQPRQLMTGLGRLFRHRLWALLAPRISVQSSLDRTRRDAILANRSQSKLRYVERPSPPSSQNRSDSPALGRLSPGRGLSQDGNRSSFGTHPESATGGRASTLGRAIGELGRIPKTLHLLNFIADPNYRRHILNQLNRGEGRGRISRKVFHGQRGGLRQRYREGQEDQLGALGLVVTL